MKIIFSEDFKKEFKKIKDKDTRQKGGVQMKTKGLYIRIFAYTNMKNTTKTQCEICKIFSTTARVEILFTLKDSSKTVSDIVQETGLSQSVVSQHLAILRNKQIVDYDKKGSWVTYSLKYPEIINAFEIIRKITKKLEVIENEYKKF
jgi:DNA-binding transcriptional ArsR family regulator